MKKLYLKKVDHKIKKGMIPPCIDPNVNESTIFLLDNHVVGFYLEELPEKLVKLLDIANSEFKSSNVPKSIMQRGTKKLAKKSGYEVVRQYSTIIGSVPSMPHMRRPYNSISSVHGKKTANIFIKSMLLCCSESEKLIEKFIPEIYKNQKEIINNSVIEKYKFSNLFTSSISNYNTAASYHQDTRNLKNTVNAIFTKRKNATGGCLNVPDYDITISQKNNSLLVYPAWKNIHGVTPIIKKSRNGYRNSFIFYPLNGFDF